VKKIFSEVKNSLHNSTYSTIITFRQFTLFSERFYSLLAFLKRWL